MQSTEPSLPPLGYVRWRETSRFLRDLICIHVASFSCTMSATGPTVGPTASQSGGGAMIPAGVPTVNRTRLSGPTHANKNFQHSELHDTPGRKKTFKDCDFSYSVFYRCYFKEANFENCNFTGCRFYDCNFIDADFLSCDLKYALFERCQLDVPSVLSALPREPNLRRALIQNLRVNANAMGDFESQRLLVLAQVTATKDHLMRAVIGSQTYYRKKFPTSIDRMAAALRLAGVNVSGFTWGHGERIGSLAVSAVFILVMLSMFNLYALIPTYGWRGGGIMPQSLIYTFALFFDVPLQSEVSGFLFIDFIILIMRYIYFGLLVSMLYKSISHR